MIKKRPNIATEQILLISDYLFVLVKKFIFVLFITKNSGQIELK